MISGCDQLNGITSPVKYQLINDNNGHVWKINTVTGDVWMCTIEGTILVTCNHAKQI